MSGNQHLCLTDLLDRDPSSNEFFYSLSPTLQKELMNRDVGTFEELQKCAEQYRRKAADTTTDETAYFNPSCSANDCTGLIPSGSNRSLEDFDGYKNLYPFSNPPEA